MKTLNILILFLTINFCFTQEFLADVQIDYSQVQTGNTQVYKTLETSLKSFINNTKWTDKNYKAHEKINCVFAIVINAHPSADTFQATLVVQAKRPIYNSTYSSPILNINDTKFDFQYVEYESLILNDRKFSGKNLTDVIGFYLYLILGYDGDSFAPNGGDIYFKKAKTIADNTQNQNYSGWNLIEGYRTRGSLITDIFKPQYSSLRTMSYNYHRLGLDMISTNELNAKNQIVNSLSQLSSFQNVSQFYSLDIFLNTKKQEIIDIFSGGTPSTNNIMKVKELLKQISPSNSQEYWDKIKN